MQPNIAASQKVFCAAHRALCAPCPPPAAKPFTPPIAYGIVGLCLLAGFVYWRGRHTSGTWPTLMLTLFAIVASVVPSFPNPWWFVAAGVALALCAWILVAEDERNKRDKADRERAKVEAEERRKEDAAAHKAVRAADRIREIDNLRLRTWELRDDVFAIMQSPQADTSASRSRLMPRLVHTWKEYKWYGVAVPSELEAASNVRERDLETLWRGLEALYKEQISSL